MSIWKVIWKLDDWIADLYHAKNLFSMRIEIEEILGSDIKSVEVWVPSTDEHPKDYDFKNNGAQTKDCWEEELII